MYRVSSFSLFCLAAAAAQALSQSEPTPPPFSPAPVFEEAHDGAVLAAGADYAARFDAGGAQFVPALGADAERSWPIRFSLAAARVGERELALQPALPQRTGNVLSFARGAARELYVMRGTGMEQQFLFEALPARGELVLTIDVASELVGERDEKGAGLRFLGPQGGVHYGAAVAIDAAGRRTPMALQLVGGDIELRVPSSFVEAAALPLVVDPLVTSLQTFSWGSEQRGEIDFAYDATREEWLAVYELVSSSGSYHVYAQRIDASGGPIGAVIPISTLSGDWRKPRVAHLAGAGKFLVVADCSLQFGLPWVSGRLVSFAGGNAILSGEIAIARAGIDGAPLAAFDQADVGGDGDPSAGGKFAVVYSVGSNTSRNIQMRLVRADGSLAPSAPIAIATSAYEESSPRISKSNGFGPAATRTWGVLYERRVSFNYNGAFQLWMALIDRNGAPRSLLGTTTWVLDGDLVSDRAGHDISSPTDEASGQRYLLAVQSRGRGTDGANVLGHLVTHQGLGGPRVDLTQLESSDPGYRAKDQLHPVVDSDGLRFAVAFQHAYSATDQDVRISTFARSAAGELVVQEAASSFAATRDLLAAQRRRRAGALPRRLPEGGGLDARADSRRLPGPARGRHRLARHGLWRTGPDDRGRARRRHADLVPPERARRHRRDDDRPAGRSTSAAVPGLQARHERARGLLCERLDAHAAERLRVPRPELRRAGLRRRCGRHVPRPGAREQHLRRHDPLSRRARSREERRHRPSGDERGARTRVA
jgi:hypothetical protein